MFDYKTDDIILKISCCLCLPKAKQKLDVFPFPSFKIRI